jgi:hypothetical protein
MILSKASRPITGMAYLIKQGGIEPYYPAPDHPTYGLIQRAEYYSKALDYSLQKQFLEPLLKKEQIDIFVASYNVKELKADDTPVEPEKSVAHQGEAQESIQSHHYSDYCVWSEGITSWLPRAEEVVFCGRTDDNQFDAIASASWDRCQAEFGHYLKKIDCYPERWEVKDFPSTEELARITRL